MNYKITQRQDHLEELTVTLLCIIYYNTDDT